MVTKEGHSCRHLYSPNISAVRRIVCPAHQSHEGYQRVERYQRVVIAKNDRHACMYSDLSRRQIEERITNATPHRLYKYDPIGYWRTLARHIFGRRRDLRVARTSFHHWLHQASSKAVRSSVINQERRLVLRLLRADAESPYPVDGRDSSSGLSEI